MLLLIYLCPFWAILVAPVVSEENEINTQCSQYGDCIGKMDASNSINEYSSNNDTNAPQMKYDYDLTEDFRNEKSVQDLKNLLSTLTEKQDNYEKIQKDVAFVFQGVIIAVILFAVCAGLCVFSACIYCCRINIIDNRLRDDLEALSEKVKRDCRMKKSIKRAPLEPISESCNIIVEDAGVFCV